MLSTEILTLVMGTSSFFGVVGLLAYLYFALEVRRAEQTIQGLIGGEAVFKADQVLEILSKFQDDSLRLAALKELTRYDTRKAKDFLNKVENNIDLNRVRDVSSKRRRRQALGAGGFFIVLAVLALAYTMKPAPIIDGFHPPPPQTGQYAPDAETGKKLGETRALIERQLRSAIGAPPKQGFQAMIKDLVANQGNRLPEQFVCAIKELAFATFPYSGNQLPPVVVRPGKEEVEWVMSDQNRTQISDSLNDIKSGLAPSYQTDHKVCEWVKRYSP
jgi:hypothetical protein